MKTVLMKCQSCRSVNRVLKEKIKDHPKCGKCDSPLEYTKNVVNVTAQTFKEEVLNDPGVVLVDL